MSKRTDKKVYLTPEGLLELQRELKQLIAKRRPKVAARVRKARDFGDIIDNNEFAAATEEQTIVEARIGELEQILKEAQIITSEGRKTSFVIIGSKVKTEVNGSIDEFTIVGTHEANPAKKRISNESPVGQALLGARIGEVIEVATPIVRAKYKVLEIK